MKQKTQPLVSIIMPCWNSGKYIRESIDSALAQTYENIELIIADDGSDDAQTKQILAELDDPRIRVLHLEHQGPAAARNAAIRASKGTYLLPLDSDDLIDPPYLAEAIQILASDMTIGFVFCSADFFDARTGAWDLSQITLEDMLVNSVIHITTVFRRADFDRVGGFDPHLQFQEDWDFWLSILELGRRPVCLPKTYFHYRRRADGSSIVQQAADPEQVCKNYDYIVGKHLRLYRKHVRAFADGLRRKLVQEIQTSARWHSLAESLVDGGEKAKRSWDWRAHAAEDRWTLLAQQMPWEALGKQYDRLFSELGGIAHPARCAIGIILLQAQLGCSDEEILCQLAENPYMRAFCGLPDDWLTFPEGFMAYLHGIVTEPILQEVAGMLHANGGDEAHA